MPRWPTHAQGSRGAASSQVSAGGLPRKPFAVSSGYDTAIFNYFDREEGSPSALRVAWLSTLPSTCAMARNPHQQGYFFGDFEKMFTQLHGKEISYNNLA